MINLFLYELTNPISVTSFDKLIKNYTRIMNASFVCKSFSVWIRIITNFSGLKCDWKHCCHLCFIKKKELL